MQDNYYAKNNFLFFYCKAAIICGTVRTSKETRMRKMIPVCVVVSGSAGLNF